jgi:copper(I)-binding protein
MNTLLKFILTASAAAAFFVSAPAAAQVNVNLPWIRASSQKSVPVYMQLEAHAAGDVVLIGATSPLATSVRIVGARGKPAARLAVAAGSSLVLKPGAPHLLLVGVRQAMLKGGHVPLTLSFEAPGGSPLSVDISAEIVGTRDKTAVDHEQHHHEHSH